MIKYIVKADVKEQLAKDYLKRHEIYLLHYGKKSSDKMNFS